MARALGLKRPKLTRAQEGAAYSAATARDSIGGVERCQRCGRFGKCDRDHRQNRDPFNTTPGNLQLLGGAFSCGCHKWKTENPKEALERGFAVPSWGDPLEWPAWRHGVGWVRYLDEPDERRRMWQPVPTWEAEAFLREHGF